MKKEDLAPMMSAILEKVEGLNPPKERKEVEDLIRNTFKKITEEWPGVIFGS
ncbi:MAG: hypothetical protein Q8J64_06505 [Thermodesulfovibrionales bacterium]|nr:hypothetical protein [Thermodesulfovibrionales bacterium]